MAADQFHLLCIMASCQCYVLEAHETAFDLLPTVSAVSAYNMQVCDDYSVQLWLAAMGLDVSNAAAQTQKKSPRINCPRLWLTCGLRYEPSQSRLQHAVQSWRPGEQGLFATLVNHLSLGISLGSPQRQCQALVHELICAANGLEELRVQSMQYRSVATLWNSVALPACRTFVPRIW